MEKVKRYKGITLIALIITIIILLILTGIIISQLMGNGLFDKVKLAKLKWHNAQDLENSILADYENQILRNSTIDGARDDEDISSKIEELEQEIKNIKNNYATKSSLSEYAKKTEITTLETLSWTELASTNSTSETTKTVDNLNNYKYVVIVYKSSTSSYFLSGMVSVNKFKEVGGISTATPDWSAFAKYVSDTSVKLKVTYSSANAVLFGVK